MAAPQQLTRLGDTHRRLPVFITEQLALSPAGCGNRPGEQALSDGAIVARGALLGAATGRSVLIGAVLGGLGGAVIGAVTTPSQGHGGRRSRSYRRNY